MTPTRPRVALDTNILLDITRMKLNLFDQLDELVGAHTLVVPIQVKHELESFSTSRGKIGVAARVALELIEKRKIRVILVIAGRGDDAMRLMGEEGCIIVTNDRALRQSLKNAPQRAIVVRASRHLEWAPS